MLDQAVLHASDDPPSISELAEQARRSSIPPAPEAHHSESDLASLFEGVSESDVRSAADSFAPSILPMGVAPPALDEDVPPAPFDLVQQRPPAGLSSLSGRARYIAAIAGVAAVSLFAIAGTRHKASPPSNVAAQAESRPRTPSEAASWAARPFTVDVPLESSGPASPPGSGPTAASSPAAPLAHFDLEAAAAALVDAKNSLSDCGEDNDVVPRSARATVTFAPAGHVSAVAIDASSGDAALPACVADRLRSVRIAPFSGASVTVRTTVTYPLP